MVGEEGYDDEWQDEDEWNDYESFWTEEQDWNDAYCGTEELYYKDEYGMFQRKGKGKERKARKEKTMKEKANQVMARASQTMYSHQLHRILPFKTNNNRFVILLQHQVQGMVLFFLKPTQYVLMY